MDYKKIGENIKKARKEAGLTQQQLADIIERTESSIRKYEKGSVEMPYSVLERIARALKEDVDELINPTQGITMKEKTVTEMIESTREEICMNFCKYASTVNDDCVCEWQREGNDCPLDRL